MQQVYYSFKDKTRILDPLGTIVAVHRYGEDIVHHVLDKSIVSRTELTAMNCLWDGMNIWKIDTIRIESIRYDSLGNDAFKTDDPYKGHLLIQDQGQDSAPNEIIENAVVSLIEERLKQSGVTELHPLKVKIASEFDLKFSREDRGILPFGLIITRPAPEILSLQFYMPSSYHDYYDYKGYEHRTLKVKKPMIINLNDPDFKAAESFQNELRSYFEDNWGANLRFEDCTNLFMGGYFRAVVYYESYWSYLIRNILGFRKTPKKLNPGEVPE